MTLKDNLEIGLKPDAPYRKDNLPEDQVRGPEIPAGPDRSPIVVAAALDAEEAALDPAEEEHLPPKPEQP
jgi:hypothetical protein